MTYCTSAQRVTSLHEFLNVMICFTIQAVHLWSLKLTDELQSEVYTAVLEVNCDTARDRARSKNDMNSNGT